MDADSTPICTSYLTSHNTPTEDEISDREVVGGRTESTPHPVSLHTPVRDRTRRGVDLETLICVSETVDDMLSKVTSNEEISAENTLGEKG